ncbi:hypothetical protein PN499_07565 [Kamptonema animale CS-326]|nr:hypothetical protein [Kamptonema animale CS-326]
MTASFYVHIIESPSPEELLNGITEGRALCSFLDIAEIPYLYNLAVTPEQFDIAMTDRVELAVNKFELPPILHFSTHGGEEGIQLTTQRDSGDVVKWAELAVCIRSIHQIIGDIGVCMSCCRGAKGIKMAQVIRAKDVPFAWIIGTSTEIDIRDAALAFAVFYHRLHGDNFINVDELLNAMRAASGVPEFNIWFGDLTQKQYTKEQLQALQQKLKKRQKRVGSPD